MVPASSFVAFRVAFGLMGALSGIRFVARGWVDRLYVEPSFHFTYPGLGWVRPLPAAAMYVLHGGMVLAALAVAFGWRRRLAAAVFTACFAYFESIDVATYLNHYELVTVVGLLMIVIPEPTGGQIPRWVLRLLRFQLGIVYVFAGLAKLNADWLLRGEPLYLWLQARTEVPLLGPLFGERAVAIGLSWVGAAFDLLVVAGLSWRRTRVPAYVALVGFHVATGLLFPRIGVFPVMMILLTPIFFEPDWPQRVLRRRRPSIPPRPATTSTRPAWITAALCVWVVVHLVVPLRHLAIPGDVRWTEEGYRWSWRVLLTEKTGRVTFSVVDPDTGRAHTRWPSEQLAPFQVEAMSTRPELIVQYARHLADQAESSGYARPRVYADAVVSMNGQPPRPLIDPRVDLATEGADPILRR
jgi:vitamin K-dependent gamma-carboxylase